VSSFLLSDDYLKNLISEISSKKPTKQNSNKRREILGKFLESFMLRVFAGGIQHGSEEAEKARKYFRKKFAEVETTPIEPVVPEDAVKWYSAYAIYLAGVLDQAVLDKARDIIGKSIEEGLHWKDIVKQLQNSEDFKNFTDHRLKTIAGTETTKAYNKGRLEQFKADPDFVQAVQYSAVLDKRTTQICKRLNGKIMDINNPLVNVYLPPNHFNCRSIIVPVTSLDSWTESDFKGVERPKEGFSNPNWRPK
jgi:SPP1 gp7 family putative phage head morphogenesis protein